jgi:DNA helicase-2/ATP-dependent DNA helicase PcrA
LRLLAPAGHENLFVIGDPNQAIYGFRGAQPKYFSRFSQDWPGARTITLGETYRLPGPVLELARKTLGGAGSAASVPRRTQNIWEQPAILLESADAQGEMEQIAGLIDFLVGGGSHLALEDLRLRYAGPEGQASFRDFAILYRFHALGQAAQKHLQAAGIPCQLAREAQGPEFTGIDRLAEKVTLLTLHAAKGLEFPYVFLIGCEAGLLPYEPDGAMAADPAEERRLVYVGLTRASRQVFLSYVRQRYLWGEPGSGQPAGWLRNLQGELAENPLKKKRGRKPRQRQRSLF